MVFQTVNKQCGLAEYSWADAYPNYNACFLILCVELVLKVFVLVENIFK